ncbi:MAG: hypothetical protein HKP10_01350, partial [Kiritimatiellales bacterium]|nr:hypothetical protein [Kiritimatiellales bacterium]
MNFFAKRKLKKQLKEYLHAARHARHMREDIADPKDIEALKAAEAVVREIKRTGEGNVENAVEALAAASDKVYPSHNNTGLRENIEVLIVALGAAMAIRAFFLEPFKIPTGSMQPTLNGITVEAQAAPGIFDNPITKFPKWLLTGTSYKEIRAKVSGPTSDRLYGDRDKIVLEIGGEEHRIPVYMRDELVGKIKSYYNKGDVIVSARVIAG